MKFRSSHLRVLAYAEWCIETGRCWPKLSTVARDCCIGEWAATHAFNDLQAAGLLTCRHVGDGLRIVVRLGDGRETRADIPPISTVILRTGSNKTVILSDALKTRIAA